MTQIFTVPSDLQAPADDLAPGPVNILGLSLANTAVGTLSIADRSSGTIALVDRGIGTLAAADKTAGTLSIDTRGPGGTLQIADKSAD
jgi:hypothetical protein